MTSHDPQTLGSPDHTFGVIGQLHHDDAVQAPGPAGYGASQMIPGKRNVCFLNEKGLTLHIYSVSFKGEHIEKKMCIYIYIYLFIYIIYTYGPYVYAYVCKYIYMSLQPSLLVKILNASLSQLLHSFEELNQILGNSEKAKLDTMIQDRSTHVK